MGKFNEVVKDVCNMINSLLNEQEIKYYIKKGGNWKVATGMDLLFLNDEKFADVLPRKRGDLLQTNNWEGFILASFLANKNGKDTHYVANQLADAEKMAPAWLRDNSNLVQA